MTDPYRTLFIGALVQQSGASFGGHGLASPVDAPIAVDGRGRATLRGTTLAGALVATARKLYVELPESISGKPGPGPQTDPAPPSVWRIFSTHPDHLAETESRQGVGIRQATGASAQGVLFDTDVLPRGTRWWLCLEVDTWRGGQEAESYAAAALLEWTYGRCWVGRSVARGLGWFSLRDLVAYRLTTDHIDQWPDSRQAPQKTLARLTPTLNGIGAADFHRELIRYPPTQPWHYLDVTGSLSVGAQPDAYGLDPLSISGHAANLAAAHWEPEHYLKPQGQAAAAVEHCFEPDTMIVLTRNATGQLVPYIPGSSLRGPLRHALSRQLRTPDTPIWDPNAEAPPSSSYDPVLSLFGSIDQSARLLVRDTYLADDQQWTAAWLHHHAEDEFSAGAYAASKFDRVVLTAAVFNWKMVIECKTPQEIEGHWARLAPLWRLGAARHLPIGGGKWRGCGWVEWQLTDSQLYRAGEPDAIEQCGGAV